MKQLEALLWKPKWISHMGCIKGCLDFLKIRASDAWVYGVTGHAFILNIHETVCPSGPTAWNTEAIHRLGAGIGYKAESVLSQRSEKGFAAAQKRAWEMACRAIDKDVPCYGWELAVPEFYVINGYDDTGYLYAGPLHEAGAGPKPWHELGSSDIGCLEVHALHPADKLEEPRAIAEALRFAVEFAAHPEKWTADKYRGGPAGYDAWMNALEAGKADGFGMAYNAIAWEECREQAVAFLKEAQLQCAGDFRALFDDAVGHYRTVANELRKVSDLFPFLGVPPEKRAEYVRDLKRCEKAVNALRTARDTEAEGLGVLEKIAVRL